VALKGSFWCSISNLHHTVEGFYSFLNANNYNKFENTSLAMEWPLCICTVRSKVFGLQVYTTYKINKWTQTEQRTIQP